MAEPISAQPVTVLRPGTAYTVDLKPLMAGSTVEWYTNSSTVPAGMTMVKSQWALTGLTGTPTTEGDTAMKLAGMDANGDDTGQSVTLTIRVATEPTEPEPEPEEPEQPEEPEPDPAVARVARFLGQDGDADLLALIAEHLPVVTAMARAYTRDGGFKDRVQPADDIMAVITAATCRLVANPEQLRYQAGSVSVQDSFRGWTLAETAVLNRYRRRAQ